MHTLSSKGQILGVGSCYGGRCGSPTTSP